MAKVGLWLRKGIYYLRWRQDNHQCKLSLGHCDKNLAQEQAKQKEAELALLLKGKFRRTAKLAALCENYLMTNRRIESSTADLTKRVFRYIVEVLGDIEICRFGYVEAEKFQMWIIETGRAKTTANIWIKTVRPVFRWAIRQQMTGGDPFENLGLFRIARKRIRIYSKDEFAAMMSATPNRLWKARMLLAKTAGLRRSEILNLTTDDVDFEKGVIYVQAKAETKTTWNWQPKDKDYRQLPLISELSVMLSDILLSLPPGQPYMMITAARYARQMEMKRRGRMPDRLRRCPDENWQKPFKRILKRAGIKTGTFHDLRKTCITEWLEAALQPHEAKELAGHSDIKTTMNHYVAVRDELVDKARAASEKCLVAVN